MRTVHLSWPVMAIVLLAMYTCLGAPVDAEKKKPEKKLDPGALEYIRRLEALCNLRRKMARLRHYKRDIREADLSKLLYPDIQDSSVEAGLLKQFYPDIHGSSVQAVLWKQLFPDSQDTSVKSRPEDTYML